MGKVKFKESKKAPATMGFQGHPITAPQTIVPRTFRWTLSTENHTDIRWWVRTVKNNCCNKTLNIKVFDDAKGVVFNWIQDLINREKATSSLKIEHLDGGGNAIAVINFIGVKITDHFTNYNYDSSDILTHELILSYSKMDRVNN
jgi:hypothetical protein